MRLRMSFLVVAFVLLPSLFGVLSAQNQLPAFQTHFASSSLGPVQTQESLHFKVSWVHPRDEVLVEPLLAHLEEARQFLVSIFGDVAIHKEQKAPVEIFPDLPSFSAVSGLSLARFRATGTIALTLEQRLMILSPRNLVTGYAWAETAVHEYVHYLIREISPQHIPIWLHEGVAQLFQAVPQRPVAELRPSQWGLFKRRRDQLKLLDLTTLQEPFPYRETPEEAELAYIQALLFSQWLDQQCGVLSLIRAADKFKSIEKALEDCVGRPVAQIEREFIQKIMAQVAVPEGQAVEFFARDFASGDPLEKEGLKTSQRAQNLAQLSTEIFRQGRFRASAQQMERALNEAEVAPPSWRRQMAEALIQSEQRQDSERVLRDLLRDYPDDAAGWFMMGQDRRRQGDIVSAWQAFVNAFFRNPFLDGLQEQMQALKDSPASDPADFPFRLQ